MDSGPCVDAQSGNGGSEHRVVVTVNTVSMHTVVVAVAVNIVSMRTVYHKSKRNVIERQSI